MLNLWDILFLPSDLGLSPSAKIWRKCTAPLGILRKSTVAFRIIQYIDRSFSFLPHLFSKKPKKSAKHSICASLGGTRSWPCSLLCCSQPSWCPSVPQLAASCPCPAHAAWHYPLQCFFFFWCVSEATRAGLASACEVCAASRSQLTTRNAHPLQASDQCDVTHNSPWTTYCTKWEPLAVQTKT